MSTIAAISTPYGIGGISVVRVSGENAIKITQKIFRAHDGTLLENMNGYTCKLGNIIFENNTLDEVIVTVFKAPRSYTGEDSTQISCHGSMFITKSILRAVLSSGAVMAGPGEFTKRAFLNKKISLDKAESVMGLISSNYEKARKINYSAYCGFLGKKIDEIKNKFFDILSDLNAEIDYSDEDVPELDNNQLILRLENINSELNNLIKSYSIGCVIKNGLKVAILGAPNVGKSTLMNFLSKKEKSIVTDIAGTTRDAIEESIILNNIPIVLIDTAGIRETSDKIEQIGTQKSKEIAEISDLILFMLDASREFTDEEIKIINSFDKNKILIIINKSDINSNYNLKKLKRLNINNFVLISAKNGTGIDNLSKKIEEFIDFGSYENENLIIMSERQYNILLRAQKNLENAIDKIKSVPRDIFADILKESAEILCEFSGENLETKIVDS
ncbi:MAG: tRNA uridine-5-carboxymethylaminomethyl(34) synthesis GTPase MnmE, partial [Clostridia bacterium]|nr:tRNA uridine-5-carboxymethylaminomethyl(34) synthesis GTPase MnmE [Clostridia bacterium]